MYYKQYSLFPKMIEPTILFIALFLLSMLTDFLTPMYEYFIILFITLIISSRYGISIALFVFLEALVYIFINGIYKGHDILLYFYSSDYWMSWIFLLIISLYCGLMSTSQKERYEDIHMINNELKAENKELKYVMKQLDETRITLRSRVLESNNHLSKMYHMFKALNHTHPEIVLDEGMNVLKMYFGAEKIGIYHVDNNKQSLRIKLRSETGKNTLPQSIFVKDASLVIKNAITHNRPFFRTDEDSQDAPLLVGPVLFQDNAQYIIILDEIEFSKVTSEQFELFTWYLRWMSDRLQNASNLWLSSQEDRTFPKTSIYYENEFEHLLKIEKKRYKTLSQPYSYFEVNAPQDSLEIINSILQENLRDIDLLGYNVSEQKIMILLPGTEEKFLQQVQTRIQNALSSKGVMA
ncbi:nucleoside-diphosphate sugar epimerase [Bacillus sp. TH13]|uniref:nucleoside-diphosphate sugar epimerase n=1 Tax=Bacillus sp. TH13 TaxID=2796379 RepID=UPI0019115FD4|nr:nucleoside-diphosphate sugar epimerase [Bacillus sp. TH13]MBK5491816.1 nucleoside-diphosphate sugar epimerase [Bacillus sp. TH13]